MVTKTVDREVEVEIDLDDFTDDEIQAEYEARFPDDGDTQLDAIYVAMRQNAEAKAYELMRGYVLDKLGKVI